jgi:hypothetical protein
MADGEGLEALRSSRRQETLELNYKTALLERFEWVANIADICAAVLVAGGGGVFLAALIFVPPLHQWPAWVLASVYVLATAGQLWGLYYGNLLLDRAETGGLRPSKRISISRMWPVLALPLLPYYAVICAFTLTKGKGWWPANYPSALWWVLVLSAGAAGATGIAVKWVLGRKRQEARAVATYIAQRRHILGTD